MNDKMDRKVSFLIAAHNEEKIISKTLENLLKLPYDNFEVIIGLDGCTDNTEEIVKEFCKKSKKFRYFVLNIRKGKAAVINYIIKKARGEIVIINDADWIFQVKNAKMFRKFISVFDNPEIGGIADAFPVEYTEEKLENGNLGYRMVAWSSFFWIEFQKKNFTCQDKLVYLKEPMMFLTNVFRRNLHRENLMLGDDFERTYNIMQNKKIVLFNNKEMPRMTAVYDMISLKDLFRQKIRTAIARKQIKDYNSKIPYISMSWYMLKNSWKFNVGMLVSLWFLLSIAASLFSKFKSVDTGQGWKLRARK